MIHKIESVYCGREEDNGMSKRWSKLQKRLYNLIDPSLDFQIHCVLYEMSSKNGYHGSKLPRYFVTIGKEIVWDYPKDFDTFLKYGYNSYPWDADISEISNLIEQYIQCPKVELMDKVGNDEWGITDILRVCDRRLGNRRLYKIRNVSTDEKIIMIINKRLNFYKGSSIV